MLAAAAILASSVTVMAQSGTWTLNGEGDWSTPGNWTGGTVANGEDNTATFSSSSASAALIHLDSDRTIGNLTFTGGSGFFYTIDNDGAPGNILTLSRTSGTPLINVANATTATISAIIDGNDGLQTQSGGSASATLILTAANTYTGATTITSGMVRINSNANFGASANSLTINHASGGIQFGEVVNNLRGITIGNSGARLHTNGFDVSYSSSLSGAGAINKLGTGTLTLAGDNSAYSGQISVTQGWLQIDSNARLGGPSSLLALNNLAGGGTGGLRFGSAFNNLRNIEIGGNGSTSQGGRLDTNGFDVQYSGTMTQNSANPSIFTKDGDGALTMMGTLSYTGATVVNGGELIFDKSGSGTAATTAGLTLRGAGFGLVSGGAGQTFSGVTVDSGRGTLSADGGTITAGTVTAAAAGTAVNFVTANGGAITVSNTNDGSGILGRRLVFNGQDWAAVSGGTVGAFSGYTDDISSAGAGTGAIHYRQTDSGSIVGSASVNTLKLTDTLAGQVLSIDTMLSLEGSGLLYAGANGYSITGGTLRSGAGGTAELLVHAYGGGPLTINSAVAASNLVIAGTGEVVLASGTGNAYTGQTFVNDATVSVSANDQLGAAGTGAQINLNGGTLRATSTFALNNSGANHRNIVLGGSGGTIDVTSGNTLTVSGVVSTLGTIANNNNVSGLGSLTKNGSGTLILSNTNTYGGRTNVREGKLVVSGSAAGSAVFVSSGATLASGNNTSSAVGAVTVESDAFGGGVLSPGDSDIGLLIVNGHVNLGTLGSSGRATLSIGISGEVGGSGYDQLQLTGSSAINLFNVDLEGALLGGYTPNGATFNSGTNQYNLDGDMFFIAIGADSVNGEFANQTGEIPLLVGFETISFDGQQFAISYSADSATNSFTGGNDIALMALIPEPSSCVMLILGLGAFVSCQRRLRAPRA